MKFIENMDLEGKKVILRVDYNVPIKNFKVTDDNRIIQSLKTINYLIEKNCKIILLSHLGKVKTEEDKQNNSLLPVFESLGSMLKTKVIFCNQTRGEKLDSLVSALEPKDILLVENTRFEDVPDKLESNSDEELSKYWASLGDIFVLDAFGSVHRAHASTYGISKYIPHCVGYLVEKETKILDQVINDYSKTIILGGAKVEDKLNLINNLIKKCDKMLIGGAMSFTFLKALGNKVGKSLIEDLMIENCKNLLENYPNKIILPIDFVTSLSSESQEIKIREVNQFNEDEIGFDIGPKTIQLFKQNLGSLVVWNGPMGMFENKNYENGTKELLEYLNQNNIKTIICGGDTGAAAHQYNLEFYHISTGGGASLEYLEQKKMEALEIMED